MKTIGMALLCLTITVPEAHAQNWVPYNDAPIGRDTVRGSNGFSCSTDTAGDPTLNINAFSTENSGAGVGVGLTIPLAIGSGLACLPLGKRKRSRINCQDLYQNELRQQRLEERRLELEVQLLEIQVQQARERLSPVATNSPVISTLDDDW